LHHQRPGFLSYPSSHLVPYLRTRKFPRRLFPDLYGYRDLAPRLNRKITRAYRHNPPTFRADPCVFTEQDVKKLHPQHPVDLLLTSPPYMNALDYGRDNRLRLWLLGHSRFERLDRLNCRSPEEFTSLITCVAKLADGCLTQNGKIVLVVGEIHKSSRKIDTGKIVQTVFESSDRFKLIDKVTDPVPDVRRSRRGSKTTKREWIMTFSRIGGR
jgi:hypothetical protein